MGRGAGPVQSWDGERGWTRSELGWGEGSCVSRQSRFDTRGSAAHSNKMPVSAAADLNSLSCHPPTSRKARQAPLTTPTGNLPSEQRLSRRPQPLRDLPGAEKCHPAPVHAHVPHAAGSPRQPTTAPGSWLGGESRSWVRVSKVLLLRVYQERRCFLGCHSLRLRREVENRSPAKQNVL